MTLIELSESISTHWSVSEELERFFRKNSKFENAKVIQEGLISDNFTTCYSYSNAWVVDLGGKLYNIILNEGDSYNRRNKAGIKFQRYYPDGNKPKRKIKSEWEFNYKRPWEVVPINKSEGKRNDCQIWTVAVCLGISYTESFQLLYANGWREENARNEYLNDWKGIFAKKGKKYVDYWSKWNTKGTFKGSTLGGLLKRLPNTGTFIVGVKGHILAIVDGVIIDSCFNAGCRAKKVYEVINL